MNKYVQIVFFLKSGKTLTENVYLPEDNEEAIIKLKEIKEKEKNVKRCIANNHIGCIEFNNLIKSIKKGITLVTLMMSKCLIFLN